MMKFLIKLNLIQSTQIKYVVFTSLFFLIFVIFQVYFFRTIEPDLQKNLLDFFLYSFGGFRVEDPLLTYYAWLIIILPFTSLLYTLFDRNTAYEIYVLSRISSRLRWLVAKYISVLLLVLFYIIWIVIIHILVGSTVFNHEWRWSNFSLSHFSFLVDLSTNPMIVAWITLAKLFVGIMEMSALLFILSLVFRHKLNFYITFVLVIIAFSFCYKIEILPDYLSILTFPAFIHTAIEANGNWNVIQLSFINHVSLLCVFLVVGCVIVRKLNFSK